MAKPKKNKTEPVSLPMLPLRGLMVFPHMVLHFDVGRKKSVAALEQAMAENQRIFLVAQCDMDVDDPAIDDIYHVGTIACVKQVKYAVNPRNTRSEYRGVLFQNRHIWALEGHRAGCCDDGGLNVEKSFTVGVPALEQLKAFGDADMQISVADNWVLFQNEHVRLLAKRIQNVTPMTYESVVPQKWNEEFCFHRKDFVQALKYLLACIGKADKPYVRFHNGTLSLRVNGCLYKASVPISMKSSIVFGFDARFMLDALTQFEKQELVTMRLTGSLGAISLVAGGSSAIVLPVRLREEQVAA